MENNEQWTLRGNNKSKIPALKAKYLKNMGDFIDHWLQGFLLKEDYTEDRKSPFIGLQMLT